MASNLDAGHAIAAAARALYQGQTLDETLQRIVDVARTSVPGFDHVGISTVDKKGHPTTRAAAGDLVEVLDAVQYDLGEGPCVDALREADAVVAPDLAADRRWPRYVPAAVQHGVRSQMAIKLYLDEEGTLGGLNLYSTASSAIDPQAEPMAELFATHAALALGRAGEGDTQRGAVDPAGDRPSHRHRHGAVRHQLGPGIRLPRESVLGGEPQAPRRRAGTRCAA